MKYLPNVFVVLLSAGFGLMMFLWQEEKEGHKQAREKILQYRAVIKKQNTAMAAFNKEKAREMVKEIKDEIQNRGIRTNQSLEDTIQLIFKSREALFENPGPSSGSILSFCEMLKGIYEGELTKPLSPIKKKDHPVYSSVADLTDENIWKQDLLEKEKMVYELFDERLGWRGCFGGPKHLIVFSKPKSKKVIAGEPFEAEIGLQWDPYLLPQIAKVEMNPRIGTVEDDITLAQSTRKLYIPTKQLLKPNQNRTTISYGLKFKIPKATGGYELLYDKFEFTVVAPCETP